MQVSTMTAAKRIDRILRNGFVFFVCIFYSPPDKISETFLPFPLYLDWFNQKIINFFQVYINEHF